FETFEEGRPYRPDSYRKPQRGESSNPSGKAPHAYLRARKKRTANGTVSSSGRKLDVLRCGRLSRPNGGTGKARGEQEAFDHSFENGSSQKRRSGQGHGIARNERHSYYRKI